MTHTTNIQTFESVYGPGILHRRPEKNYKTQRLLLGTHTNDEEPNYLQIASVQLPKSLQNVDPRKYEEVTNGKKKTRISNDVKGNPMYILTMNFVEYFRDWWIRWIQRCTYKDHTKDRSRRRSESSTISIRKPKYYCYKSSVRECLYLWSHYAWIVPKRWWKV